MRLRVPSIEMSSSSELAPGTLNAVVPCTMIVVNISWLKAMAEPAVHEPNNLASHPLVKLVQLVLPSGR
jgi:hypothetical protein